MLSLAANGQVRESDGRAVDARDVVGVRFRGAGVIGRDEQLVVRNDAHSAVDDLCVPDEKPSRREPSQQLVVYELVDARTCHGDAEQEEPEQHRQLVRVSDPPQVRRQLG